MTNGSRFSCILLTLSLAACGESVNGPDPIAPPPQSNSATVLIEGPSQLAMGDKATYKAFLVFDSGQRRDVTHEARWGSSNTGALTISTVSASAVAQAPGRATVSAQVTERWIGRWEVSVSPTDHRPESLPAVLVVEALSVTVNGQTGGYFGYTVRFRLRETGGQSSAVVGNIVVSGVDESGEFGPGCWGGPVIVPAGGTLDLFETDAGAEWLGYCGLFTGGRTQTPTLRVIVNFIDDQGRAGRAEAAIAVTR